MWATPQRILAPSSSRHDPPFSVHMNKHFLVYLVAIRQYVRVTAKSSATAMDENTLFDIRWVNLTPLFSDGLLINSPIVLQNFINGS